MRKHLAITAILAIVTVFAVLFAGFIKKENKKITAREWIVNQYHLMDQFDIFSSTLDDVVTVYAIGSMDTSDLMNELDIANAELDIMKKDYDENLQEHPIKTGSHTYETKLGKEGLERIWDGYYNLISQMEQICMDTGSADEIAYAYLGYREVIADGLFDYIYSYYSLTDPSKLEAITETKKETETNAD